MKMVASFLAALLLTGTLGALNDAMAKPIAKDGTLSKSQLSSDAYCHERFPAIREATLDNKKPVLENSNTGDVIDFYGPCDENPTGKDQVQKQELQDEHRFEMEYSD